MEVSYLCSWREKESLWKTLLGKCILTVFIIIIIDVLFSLALSSWLSTVRDGLEWLHVHGPGFNSQGWPGNLGQDRVRVCFEINFSERKEGSTVSSIICDRWRYVH